MTKPAPTYRIVNANTGKEIKPYQNAADMAAFISRPNVTVLGRNTDSPALNLHTIYVELESIKDAV